MTTIINWSQCADLEQTPEKVSGAWLFRGTRVPVSAVLDNLKDLSIDEVLAEFPSIQREQVVSVLDFVARSAEVFQPH